MGLKKKKFEFEIALALVTFFLLFITFVFFLKSGDTRISIGYRFIIAPDTGEWGEDYFNALSCNKRVLHFQLTGDIEEDTKRFEVIQQQSRLLLHSKDQSWFIQIHFSEVNTYGDLMKLIEMMHTDRHKRYTLFKDDFYIIE